MGEKKEAGAGAEKKKEEDSITVVFKVDMHCDGCAKKISKSVKKLHGVESVSGDSTTNKLTVKGKVEPSNLRENIEYKTKKKVELISPQPSPKKQEATQDKKKPQADADADDNKKKEPSPSTTVVFKIRLHCDGCTHRIRKIINKFKGVQGVDIDTSKDLVTVKGVMDVNQLHPYLKDKLKRSVDILSPNKQGKPADADADNKAKLDAQADKKAKDAGEGDKKKEQGGDKKKEAGVVGEAKKMEHHSFAYENGYGYGYGHGHDHGHDHGYPGHVNGYYANPNANLQLNGFYANPPAPQIFSDENPNACSVM